MIEGGFAHEYTFNNTAYKYQEVFKAGQQAAADADRGLGNTGTCAGNTAQPAQ